MHTAHFNPGESAEFPKKWAFSLLLKLAIDVLSRVYTASCMEDFMYLLFAPAVIAFGIIGFITLRDQFQFSPK